MPRTAGFVIATVALVLSLSTTPAYPLPVKGGSAIPMPYRPPQGDGNGNQWLIYAMMFRTQGNSPVYSEGAMLYIDNNNPTMNRNMARLDDNGEAVFENLTGQNYTLTRRVLADKDGYIRIIDIIKNNQPNELTYNLMYRSQPNFGIQSSQNVNDPQKKDATLACVAQDSQGRAIVELFAGRGAKILPAFNSQPQNGFVTTNMSLKVPAGKEIAILHVHATAANTDAGIKLVKSLSNTKILAGVPAALRRLIVNFAPAITFGGDVEILRGDTFDVVETRTGESFKGTIKDATFKIQTFFGPLDISADKVLGMVSVGDINPRQVLITRDGDFIAGKLDKATLGLEMTSKQQIQIPLDKIGRFGFRKRADEPEELPADKPTVWTSTGDRITIQLPTQEFDFNTRYGTLKLKPATIASLVLQGDEHEVHQVILTDGSHLAGLIVADTIELKLASGDQALKFPMSVINRLQLKPTPEESDDSSASLTLTSHDRLVGILTGQLKLETSFNTLTLAAEEIKRLSPRENEPTDVEVTLADDSLVRGRIQEREVTCHLKSGDNVKVPLAMLDKYLNPEPRPPVAMLDSIKQLVHDFDSEDFKDREAAQEKLTAMGVVVVGVLKEVRPSQSPEAQQRIDRVLAALTGAGK